MNIQTRPVSVPTRAPHILVVEDEILIRMMLSGILRDEGYFVTEASNADEALTFLSTKWPDLIVTDVRMPGSCDGLEFASKVRETHATLPIIITSSHLVPFTGQFDRATQFLSKPYDFDVIIGLVKNEMQKRLLH